jgi:hypothetical protein
VHVAGAGFTSSQNVGAPLEQAASLAARNVKANFPSIKKVVLLVNGNDWRLSA